MTHLPPNDWCFACLLGKSSSASHRSHEAHKPVIPVIQLECSFLKSSCEPQNESENAWATTLYSVDAPAQNGIALSIPTKSTKIEDYATRQVVAVVRRMAYQGCKLRPDNEPALVSMTEKIVAGLKKEGIRADLEPPARYSSQSFGFGWTISRHTSEAAHNDANGFGDYVWYQSGSRHDNLAMGGQACGMDLGEVSC